MACHLEGTLPFGMYLEDKSNDVFVMEKHISIYIFPHMVDRREEKSLKCIQHSKSTKL